MIYNELEYLKCIVSEIFGNCCSEIVEVILTYGNKLTLSQLLRLTNYNFRVLRNVLLHLIKHNVVEIQVMHIQKGKDRECNHRNLTNIVNSLKEKKNKNAIQEPTEGEENAQEEEDDVSNGEGEQETKEESKSNNLLKFMYGCKCHWCICKIKKVQYSVCVQNIYIHMRFPSILYYMHPTNYEEKRNRHMNHEEEIEHNIKNSKQEKPNPIKYTLTNEYNFFINDISDYEEILFETSKHRNQERTMTKKPYVLSWGLSNEYTKKSNEEIIKVAQFIQKVILMRIAKNGRLTIEESVHQIKLDDYINVCEKEIPFINKKKLKLLFFLLLKKNFIKKVKTYNDHICEFSKKAQMAMKREREEDSMITTLNPIQKPYEDCTNIDNSINGIQNHKETKYIMQNQTNPTVTKEILTYNEHQDFSEKEKEQELESDEIIFLKSVKENRQLDSETTKKNPIENKETVKNKRRRTVEIEPEEPTKENKRRRGRESKKEAKKNKLESEETTNKKKKICKSNEKSLSQQENECINEISYYNQDIHTEIIQTKDERMQESMQTENELLNGMYQNNMNTVFNQMVHINDEQYTHFQINAEVLTFVFLKQECFNFIIQYYRFNEVIKCIFFFLLKNIYFQFSSASSSDPASMNHQVSFCTFEQIEHYVNTHFKRKQMEINQNAILQNLNVLTKNPDEFVITKNDQTVSYAIDFTKIKEFYKKKLMARIVEKMIDHEGLRIWNYLISEENEKYTDEFIGDRVLIPINEVRKKLYNLLHLGLIKSHEGNNNTSNKFYMKGSILFFANMMNTIDEIKNKLFFIARKLFMRKFFENNKINLAYNKTTMFGNELEQEKNEKEKENKKYFTDNYILEDNCESLSHIEYALDYLEISLINLDKYLLFYTSA